MKRATGHESSRSPSKRVCEKFYSSESSLPSTIPVDPHEEDVLLSISNSSCSESEISTLVQSSISPSVEYVPPLSQAVTLKGFTLDNLPDHHFHLGGNRFIVVTDFFPTNIKIHIRAYYFTRQRVFIPSSWGISMTARCFLKLMQNIFLLGKPGKIQTIFKELFLSTSNDGNIHRFQKLYMDHDGDYALTSGLSLNLEQFHKLQSVLDDVWESVQRLMLGPIFRKTVLPEAHCNLLSQRDDWETQVVLIDSLKTLITGKIYNLFECPECISGELDNEPHNQLQHTCISTEWDMKVHQCFDEAVASLNPITLAKAFLEKYDMENISMEFLMNINAVELFENVKEACENINT